MKFPNCTLYWTPWKPFHWKCLILTTISWPLCIERDFSVSNNISRTIWMIYWILHPKKQGEICLFFWFRHLFYDLCIKRKRYLLFKKRHYILKLWTTFLFLTEIYATFLVSDFNGFTFRINTWILAKTFLYNTFFCWDCTSLESVLRHYVLKQIFQVFHWT